MHESPDDNPELVPKRKVGTGCWMFLIFGLLYFFGIHPWWTSKIPVSVRSVASRIKTDHRSLSTALELYYLDHGSYPAMSPLSLHAGPQKTIELKKSFGENLNTAELGNASLHGLTTPISYITDSFKDYIYPLSSNGWSGQWPIISIRRAIDRRKWGNLWPYPYFNDRNLGWIIWAAGPDRVYDITDPAKLYDATAADPTASLQDFAYDPTNGSYSRGDLWRVYSPSDRDYATKLPR